jgi:Mg/Co/Ni transporter MgtE
VPWVPTVTDPPGEAGSQAMVGVLRALALSQLYPEDMKDRIQERSLVPRDPLTG